MPPLSSVTNTHFLRPFMEGVPCLHACMETLAKLPTQLCPQDQTSNCTNSSSSAAQTILEPRYTTLCSSGSRVAPLIRTVPGDAPGSVGSAEQQAAQAGLNLPPGVQPVWLLAPHMVVVGGDAVSSPATATVGRADSAGACLHWDR